MDLSNLRPAEGSVQNGNFRRGRGHGSGNGKTAGKGHTEEFPRGDSNAEIPRKSWELTCQPWKYLTMIPL